MQKNLVLSVIGASALAIVAASAPVQAKDVGEWTCSDFLKVPKSQQPSVVYYLVGLNKSQTKEFHDVAAEDFKVPVSKVVQHCRVNQPDNLWQVIERHWFWRGNQLP